MNPKRAHLLIVVVRFVLVLIVFQMLDDRVDGIGTDLPRWGGRVATAAIVVGVFVALHRLLDPHDPLIEAVDGPDVRPRARWGRQR